MIKTAVVGCGRMGRRHIQVIKDLALELVGICDPNTESLALATKELAVSPTLYFTNFSLMLKEKSPECIIIATTAPTHCEYTLQAAKNGAKLILCEKPMAVSLDECDMMIAACRSSGSLLAINHQMRFMEQYTETKKIVQSPEFGGLSSISVVAGNFGLAMNGTHYFEMFRFISDETPSEVTAWFSPGIVPNPRGPQFEDRAGQVRVITPQGRRFYLEAASDQGHGVRVVYAGPYGQLYVDELTGSMNYVVREDQYREMPTTRYGMPVHEINRKIQPADSVSPTRAVLKALIEETNPPSGEDGRQAVSVLVAAYISDEKGHSAVRIDEKLPRTRIFPWA